MDFPAACDPYVDLVGGEPPELTVEVVLGKGIELDKINNINR